MGHAVFHIIFMDFLCSFHGNFMVKKCHKNVLTLDLENPFSNSLIIHEEKTKEITTVKEVWKCDVNYHKILGTFASNFSKNYQ